MSDETKEVPVERIVQVSGFGVENTALTQCNYMLVAVTNTGRVVMSMGDREWIDVSPKIPAAAPPDDEKAENERLRQRKEFWKDEATCNRDDAEAANALLDELAREGHDSLCASIAEGIDRCDCFQRILALHKEKA